MGTRDQLGVVVVMGDIEMNKAEYEAYCAAVERGLEGLRYSGSSPAVECCEECREEYGEDQERAYEYEPWFSWRSCEACSRDLGGNRHPAHAFDAEDEVIHLEICGDCVYYLEYGQLDDMTMLEVEEG